MSTDYSPASILNSKSPCVHVFSTPELDAALSRSSLPTLASLLSPFQSGVERVTVRLASGYEQKVLPSLGVQFVQRVLPPAFGDETAGAAAGRRRSSTLTNLVGAPASPAVHTPATPSTPYAWPTQADRDELFLDSVGEELGRRAEAWLAEPGRAELSVQSKRARRRPKAEDDVADGEEEGSVFERVGEVDEGWQGRAVEELTPWFATVRDQVLGRREMVEWESFNQPVACE